tara:strand:+ start:1999 stop:2172 length:174 start_codon:yes stop_codon:yes gene_type:complete
MNLLQLHERVMKKKRHKFQAGSVENVYQYNEICMRDKSGQLPTFIKVDPDEKKKRKL